MDDGLSVTETDIIGVYEMDRQTSADKKCNFPCSAEKFL